MRRGGSLSFLTIFTFAVPELLDDFHFCRSRVIGLDMTENRIFMLCRMITWVVFLRMFWNFISSLPVKRGGSLSFMVGTISNVLVMEIGWTDVGSGGYILVSCAHSNTSSCWVFPSYLFPVLVSVVYDQYLFQEDSLESDRWVLDRPGRMTQIETSIPLWIPSRWPISFCCTDFVQLYSFSIFSFFFLALRLFIKGTLKQNMYHTANTNNNKQIKKAWRTSLIWDLAAVC